MPACRAWLQLHLLFSTYPLQGTYLLTTYTCKHMRLLTRVYVIAHSDITGDMARIGSPPHVFICTVILPVLRSWSTEHNCGSPG